MHTHLKCNPKENKAYVATIQTTFVDCVCYAAVGILIALCFGDCDAVAVMYPSFSALKTPSDAQNASLMSMLHVYLAPGKLGNNRVPPGSSEVGLEVRCEGGQCGGLLGQNVLKVACSARIPPIVLLCET